MEVEKQTDSMTPNEAWKDFEENFARHVEPKPPALLTTMSMVRNGKPVGPKQMINQMEQHAPGCYELDVRIRRINETPGTD